MASNAPSAAQGWQTRLQQHLRLGRLPRQPQTGHDVDVQEVSDDPKSSNIKPFWVNYNELTTSSLEIIVSKGKYPQMALIQVSEIL